MPVRLNVLVYYCLESLLDHFWTLVKWQQADCWSMLWELLSMIFIITAAVSMPMVYLLWAFWMCEVVSPFRIACTAAPYAIASSDSAVSPQRFYFLIFRSRFSYMDVFINNIRCVLLSEMRFFRFSKTAIMTCTVFWDVGSCINVKASLLPHRCW